VRENRSEFFLKRNMHSTSNAVFPLNVANGEAHKSFVTDFHHNEQNQIHTASSQSNRNVQQDLLQRCRLFSLCFQQFVNLDFYQQLLSKLFKKAKVFDEASEETRSAVWKDVYNLLGMPPHQATSSFLPLILGWIQQGEVNLFALEILYVAFMKSASLIVETNVHNTSNNSQIQNQAPSTEIEPSQLLDASTPWGCNVPSVLYQLRLLQHWEARLEKLSACSKKTLWTTCKMMQVFSNYDEASIKRTLEMWSADPLLNLSNITIFYSALGYLKNSGVLKGDFCFPKTTVPVFVCEKDNFKDCEYSRQYPLQPSFLRQLKDTSIVTDNNATSQHNFKPVHTSNNTTILNNNTNNSNNNNIPVRTITHAQTSHSPAFPESSFRHETTTFKRELDEINHLLFNGGSLDTLLSSHKQVLPSLPTPSQPNQFSPFSANNNNNSPLLPSLNTYYPRIPSHSPLLPSMHLPSMPEYASVFYSQSYPVFPLPAVNQSEETFSRKRKQREDIPPQKSPEESPPEKPRRRNSLVGLRRNSLVSSSENMDAPPRRGSVVNAAQDLLSFSQNAMTEQEKTTTKATEDHAQQLPPTKRRRSLVFDSDTNVKKSMSISALLCHPPC